MRYDGDMSSKLREDSRDVMEGETVELDLEG